MIPVGFKTQLPGGGTLPTHYNRWADPFIALTVAATATKNALSSTLHAGVIAGVALLAAFNLSSRAAALRADERPADPMRLVFVATPGPGGGGGGGGLLQKAPPPKALREGRARDQQSDTRAPRAEAAAPGAGAARTAPDTGRSRRSRCRRSSRRSWRRPPTRALAPACLQQTPAENDSRGPGNGGGAGTGTGTGLGEGDGSGVGPGSGGGTGGGPYRPGSGIEPPRLLREVKADYTEDARRRGISGDVVLEIVVRRDGTVGDVQDLQGLAGGLNDRAVQAVRQWRFAPARRQGVAGRRDRRSRGGVQAAMTLLMIVTAASMLLAAVMSVIAWRIAGDERRRSRRARRRAGRGDSRLRRPTNKVPHRSERSQRGRRRRLFTAAPQRGGARPVAIAAAVASVIVAAGAAAAGGRAANTGAATCTTRSWHAPPATATTSRARRARPRARRRSADGPRRRPQPCRLVPALDRSDRRRASCSRRTAASSPAAAPPSTPPALGPAAKRRSRSPCRGRRRRPLPRQLQDRRSRRPAHRG